MMVRKFVFLLLLLLVALPAAGQKNAWHKHTAPTFSEPQIFGYYSAGCMDGAQALPFEGTGYRMIRPKRNRYFGHPSLIEFIQSLGKTLHNKGFDTLLISDLSAARGGHPKPGSKHLSHYNGLDADIWFKRLPKSEADKKNGEIQPVSMVSSSGKYTNPAGWSDQEIELLRTVASYKEVERILVNPRIKEALCQSHRGHRWLRKIRPWWGHDTHFHVRLRCPRGNSHCKSQAPVEHNDGCNKKLYWWFSEDAKEAARKSSMKKRELPTLPKQCQLIYKK